MSNFYATDTVVEPDQRLQVHLEGPALPEHNDYVGLFYFNSSDTARPIVVK